MNQMVTVRTFGREEKRWERERVGRANIPMICILYRSRSLYEPEPPQPWKGFVPRWSVVQRQKDISLRFDLCRMNLEMPSRYVLHQVPPVRFNYFLSGRVSCPPSSELHPAALAESRSSQERKDDKNTSSYSYYY